MFIEDLKTDFYLKIKGKRILILVNYDIDAICTCKILQSLFSTDGMLYTVVYVDFAADLQAAFHDRRTDEEFILLINCGGTQDLMESLEPEENVIFYVWDSHRPLDICNVFSSDQIRIISPPEDAMNVPEFDDCFRDSEEESDGEDEEDGLEGIEARMEKRKKRREWENRRDNIIFKYSEFSFYSRSSAAIAFDLAWKLSKDNFDLLWFAIVGVSEQLLLNKICENDYLAECGRLQQHISRLQHRASSAPEDRGVAVNIEYQKQLRLAMYKYWTVESSMIHSVGTATRLRLWTFDGLKKLHEMLAEIGIPLSQCRQKFSSMQALYRQELQDGVVKAAPRYGLNNIELGSFSYFQGYKSAISAMDTVYGLIGLLVVQEKVKAERFIDCLEALGRSKREKLELGLEYSQRILQTISRVVQSALEAGQLRSAGPYLCLVLQEDIPLFCHPYSILLLAEFALKACAGKNRARQMLPLLVSTPVQGSEANEICHIAAIPPLMEDSNKHFFGRAFERVAEKTNGEIIARYFDASVIQIDRKNRSKFFEELVQLLA